MIVLPVTIVAIALLYFLIWTRMFGAAIKKTAAAALPGVLGLWAIYVLGRVALAFVF